MAGLLALISHHWGGPCTCLKYDWMCCALDGLDRDRQCEYWRTTVVVFLFCSAWYTWAQHQRSQHHLQYRYHTHSCCGLRCSTLLAIRNLAILKFEMFCCCAGQSNMYPVITRAYEVGSNQDTLETGSANLIVGAGAGFIAAAVLALGLIALSQQGAGACCWG